MNEEMKGYWKYFAILVAGSILNLVGGVLGKTTPGYILFFVGLAVVIAGFVFIFLKKDQFKADRVNVLVPGLVLAVLLGASITLSTVLLLTQNARQGEFTPGQTPSGQNVPGSDGTLMPPDGMPEQATATTAPTATATPAPTSTPVPTATATLQTYSSLVVCLDYDQGVGENIRTSPLETGTIVGTIPMAGCFTIDGKNSQYPGWYHFSSGQNGMGGISISAYADQNNLWVYNHHFDKAQSLLDRLVEVPYTPATTATVAATATEVLSATPTK